MKTKKILSLFLVLTLLCSLLLSVGMTAGAVHTDTKSLTIESFDADCAGYFLSFSFMHEELEMVENRWGGTLDSYWGNKLDGLSGSVTFNVTVTDIPDHLQYLSVKTVILE